MANSKADIYNELVGKPKVVLSENWLITSLNIIFPNYHQDIFPENCGALKNEIGECIHYTSAMETSQIKGNSPMLADYFWIVTRDSPGCAEKQQAKR